MKPAFVTEEFTPFEFEVKSRPEDFEVEEVALYEPSGTGDHLFLWIEKRELTTLEVVARLARALKRKRREFGYAGLKDKWARTRQWISIEHVALDQAELLESEGLRVLRAERHGNKLRLGHLEGNRFRITLRGLDLSECDRLRACVSELEREGLPNAFGEQRFGRFGNGARLGAALLREDAEEYIAELLRGEFPELDEPREVVAAANPEVLEELGQSASRDARAVLSKLARERSARRALRVVPRPVRSIQLSALQSLLFNELLWERVRAQDAWRPMAGDVLWVHAKGAAFVADEIDAKTTERIANFELSPAGPLFGAKLLAATGEACEREERVLRQAGLARDDFARRSANLRGARRPFRVPLRDWSLDTAGEHPVLAFTLPKGAYATSLLAELRKRIPSRESGEERPRSEAIPTEGTSS